MFTPLNSMPPVYYIKKAAARFEFLDFLIFLYKYEDDFKLGR
ncbi:protein of unknown function [Streptococcus thermophilus]|uniref:Uncharacterized protein n=1 Tax=Streptococcus thermophilus TaxID=1308 RepID=A0A8D6U5W6_STRTR|nr:protein of unknown function [Streptococcus thermophilus]